MMPWTFDASFSLDFSSTHAGIWSTLVAFFGFKFLQAPLTRPTDGRGEEQFSRIGATS